MQAVERHLLDALRTDSVWWPANFLEQPFGPGTKVYSAKETIHMLYDLEKTSNYSQPFDKLKLISS